MKLIFLCVNFNSYFELKEYLDSIIFAANKKMEHCLNIEIFISDNSSNYEDFDINALAKSRFVKISMLSHQQNLGYLGGVDKIIRSLPKGYLNTFDYVIVSNVDLLLSSTFFLDLCNVKLDKNVGWIAPRIYSLKEKRDRNPGILYRPSLLKLKILTLIFSSPWINYLYVNLIYKRRKRKKRILQYNRIYAGHGSFMIFTNSFIQKINCFGFESFLFCEEIFLAELMQYHKLDVIYDPSISLNDIDHVSTGLLKSNIYCKWNRDSIKYVIHKFFS